MTWESETRRADSFGDQQHDGSNGAATSAVTSTDSTTPGGTDFLAEYAPEYVSVAALAIGADVSVWTNAEAVRKLSAALRAALSRLEGVLREYVKPVDAKSYDLGDGYVYVRASKAYPTADYPDYPEGPRRRTMGCLCAAHADALRIMGAVECDAGAAGEVAVYVPNRR